MEIRSILAVLGAVGRRPDLWVVGLRQALRLAGRRWWARPPFLPLPPASYLRFRMVTAHGGDGSAAPEVMARDVVVYLEWCKAFRAGPEADR